MEIELDANRSDRIVHVNADKQLWFLFQLLIIITTTIIHAEETHVLVRKTTHFQRSNVHWDGKASAATRSDRSFGRIYILRSNEPHLAQIDVYLCISEGE